jgi:ubiquinone/menaquinone biosynthesis C-methylase UbiE
MINLWNAIPEAFAVSVSFLALDCADVANSQAYRDVFDRAAAISPEAAVALYSFGNTAVLQRSTHELIAQIGRWNLLQPHVVLLDLGCGSGRLTHAAAPRVSRIMGVDVSQQMTLRGHERLRGHTNTLVVRGGGEELSFLAESVSDVVLAVDCFPYLVRCGLAEHHLAEPARVLKPAARLLIMNYSYSGYLDADRSELGTLAARFGFTVRRNARPIFNPGTARSFC